MALDHAIEIALVIAIPLAILAGLWFYGGWLGLIAGLLGAILIVLLKLLARR